MFHTPDLQHGTIIFSCSYDLVHAGQALFISLKALKFITNTFVFYISVVYVKDEPTDDSLDLKIEPARDPFVRKEDGFRIVEKQNQIIAANNTVDELVTKDEPQDELVRECVILNFNQLCTVWHVGNKYQEFQKSLQLVVHTLMIPLKLIIGLINL